MSKRSKAYKAWVDPTSGSSIPHSTQHDTKKRKAELLLSMTGVKMSNDSSESDTESIDISLKNIDNEKIEATMNIQQENQSIIDNQQPEPMLGIEQSDCSISNMENQLIIENNEDWINVILNNKDTAHSQETSDEGEEDEDEKQLYKKLKTDRKFNKNKKYLNDKVSKRSSRSIGEIILMCMLTAVRHSFTWEAMLDILNIINKLFDRDVLNLSKYKLFTFFPEKKDWYKLHIYCPDCKHYIGNCSEISKTMSCPSCQFILDDVKNKPYFLTINVKSQLKELLENPLVQHHLKYRSKRKKKNPDNIEDIYDGDLYKSLSSQGNILSDESNFSYTFNTDGCQASDSSPVSVWPVYLRINELSYKMRDEHMILVGLWVNEKKPLMNTFLQPVIDELNSLAFEGVEWLMQGKTTIKSKFIPLCCCVDSVCRCSLLNMKQFNGRFGCTFCYHPTENVNGVRKYPISEDVPRMRTHENIIKDMRATRVQNKQTGETEIIEVYGVKGPSALMNLQYFDLADGMTPDSMHSVYLGVAEQYTNIILSNSNAPYYVGSPNNLAAIDERLLSIKTPKSITRTPRSLTLRNSWKASEWRSWLLNYSLICLMGILDFKYFSHLSKLVCGIEILSRDSISFNDITRANKLLVEFVFDFMKYFGKENMTYNVHLLLHIPRSVKNLGPLYMHDAFGFENQNRLLLQMKKSPTEIAIQIAKRYLFYKSIPTFSTLFPITSRVLEFVENFENRIKCCIKVSGAIVIGAGDYYEFTEKEQQLNYTGSCLKYQKMIYKGIRYTTKSYSENLKINDSVIETHSGFKGVITNICVITNDDQQEIVIFFNPLKVINDNTFNVSRIQHIKECFLELNEICSCTPDDLKGQSILIACNEKQYLCDISQGCFGD